MSSLDMFLLLKSYRFLLVDSIFCLSSRYFIISVTIVGCNLSLSYLTGFLYTVLFAALQLLDPDSNRFFPSDSLVFSM